MSLVKGPCYVFSDKTFLFTLTSSACLHKFGCIREVARKTLVDFPEYGKGAGGISHVGRVAILNSQHDITGTTSYAKIRPILSH